MLTTSGVSNWCIISCSNPRASSQCLPFSHALMAALQLTTFGVSNWCTISCSNAGAASHCKPFSHALVAALRESLECMGSDGCERCEAVGTRRWAHFVARGEAARSGFARAVRQAFVQLPLDSEVLVGGAQRLPPPPDSRASEAQCWNCRHREQPCVSALQVCPSPPTYSE